MSPTEGEDQPTTARVLVIGAGPGGLGVAGCLAQRGVRAEMIERGEAVGNSWRNHYRRLHLHTVKQHSALPHRPFPDDYPRYVAREQVVDYLAGYAQAFGLRPRFGEEAAAITRHEQGWLTRCRSGRSFLTQAVVLATGANRRPNRPAFPGEALYRGRLSHSESYRDAQPFAGQRVLVVGMGNTGAEIALDPAHVPVDGKGLPSVVCGTGALAGVSFVGYDIRQPGGLLRTIAQQAVQVAEAVAKAVEGG